MFRFHCAFFNEIHFYSQILKEMDLNVDVDVAFLAAQTPPIKIFPTPNTSQLPYNKQLAALEADYLKYYSYRGDIKYNEHMKRAIVKKGDSKSDDTNLSYRISRDKSRFFETRIKDDVLILREILKSMIERTSEMEKYLENVLLANGEKELPNWDELYEEAAHNAAIVDQHVTVSGENNEVEMEPTASKKRKASATTRKPKAKKIATIKPNFVAAPNQLNDSNQPMLTHEQAQKLVAQMMFQRSLAHANRIHSNPRSFEDC